jgi:hypothetical protein
MAWTGLDTSGTTKMAMKITLLSQSELAVNKGCDVK